MTNPGQYRAKRNETKPNPSAFVEKMGFKHKAPKSESISGGSVAAILLLYVGIILTIAWSNDKDISRKKEELGKSANESGLVIKEDLHQLALFARDKYQLTTDEVCLLSDIAAKAAPGLPGGYGAKNVFSALVKHSEYIGVSRTPADIQDDLGKARGTRVDIDEATRLHGIFAEFNSRASDETKIKIIRHSVASSSQTYECW